MIFVQRLQLHGYVLSFILFVAFIVAAALIGTGSALYPSLIASMTLFILAWLLLVRQFELALALLTVGFFVYPLIIADIAGIATSSTLTLAFYALLATAALVGVVRSQQNRLSYVLRNPATIITILLVSWMLLSFYTMSWTNEFALRKVGYIPFLMLVPLVTGQFLNQKSIHRFFWCCIVISFLGIVLLFQNVMGIGTEAVIRPSASEGASALGFAYSVGFSGIMGLGLLNSVKLTNWQRGLILVIVAGSLFSAVVTGSRGPLLAFLVAGVFAIGFRASIRTRFLLILGMFVGVIVVWHLLPLLPSIVVARYASIAEAGNTQELSRLFTESRGNIWLISYRAWLSSPITGIGIGNFVSFSEGLTSFSHHFLLEAITELGVIGFLLLGTLLIWITKVAINLVKLGNPLDISIIALLIHSLVKMSFSGQLQASVEFWVAYGLLTSFSIKPHLLQETSKTNTARSSPSHVLQPCQQE
jgi:O-antigen ligase